ncbi:MAG TPA: hypothetical protein VFE33_10335 [Thermoanaerobaculia bacterium]|nr:hypothetical protein [Thermoanaerobaculia bacterium]
MPIMFDKRVSSWDLLNRTLKPLIKDMPELAAEQQQLEALITQARTLQSQQGDSLSQFRDAVKLRRAAEQAGQELHSRIAAILKGKLGFKNNQLIPYGLQPRRNPGPKKGSGSPTPPPPTPPPTTTPPPAVEATTAPHPTTVPAAPATK